MVQWLCASITEGVSSVPGQGTKIPHAKQCGQKIKKTTKKDTVDNFGKESQEAASSPSACKGTNTQAFSVVSFLFSLLLIIKSKSFGSGGGWQLFCHQKTQDKTGKEKKAFLYVS